MIRGLCIACLILAGCVSDPEKSEPADAPTTAPQAGAHERQLIDIISGLKQTAAVLRNVTDEKSADERLGRLEELRVKSQLQKAKNRARGDPPTKTLQASLLDRYGQEMFLAGNALQKEILRIKNMPRVYVKLKPIINEMTPYSNNPSSSTFRRSRMLSPDSALGKAYSRTYRSIGAAEQFIRDYPSEPDLCAGALLNIAAIQARQDKKKAIGSYQKAVDEYGDEIVPHKNANFTVANWALFRIARLERDIGNRDKALEIFGKLMESSDFNTRTSSRIEYLTTKQSHLKLTVEVAVQGKSPFSLGSRIPVVVSVKNPTKETAAFKCYARIEHRERQCYHALAPREGCREITLAPGEGRKVPMAFTEKDTEGVEPGVYHLKASLTGVPFDTTTVSIEIKK